MRLASVNPPHCIPHYPCLSFFGLTLPFILPSNVTLPFLSSLVSRLVNTLLWPYLCWRSYKIASLSGSYPPGVILLSFSGVWLKRIPFHR